MGTTLDHRRCAEECVVMAQLAEDNKDKALWLTLAQSWVRRNDPDPGVRERRSFLIARLFLGSLTVAGQYLLAGFADLGAVGLQAA